MKAEWCIYDAARGGMACQRCGAFRAVGFPIQARELAELAGEFQQEHAGCKELPRRVRLSRSAGWRMPANTVKVDRSTPWGNPFVPDAPPAHFTLLECLAKFERHAAKLDLSPLRGKNLACWCKEGQLCHADILLRLANAEEVPA